MLATLMRRSEDGALGSTLVALLLAGLLFAIAGIHLDLYVTGYRHIRTIGVLFLLQVIATFSTGLAVLVVRRPVVLAGAGGLAASTLGGYLLIRAVGLFGFHEVPTTAGALAGGLELGALAVALVALGRAAVVPRTPLLALGGGALVLGSVLLGVAALPATSTGPGSVAASATSGGASQLTIVIKNFAFVPAKFTVHPGERITVHNEDSVAHTFTAMPGSVPLGRFDTGPIAPGHSKTITLGTTPGTFAFYCGIHPFMTGSVTVS